MHMNKILYGIIGLLFVIIIGVGVSQLMRGPRVPADAALPASASASTSADAMPQDTGASPAAPTTAGAASAPAPETYTLAQVKAHASESDCWIAVSGSVYDVTSFIPRHPGGPQRIIKLCGTDATAAFTGQHGGQEKPEAMLASLKIGTLAR